MIALVGAMAAALGVLSIAAALPIIAARLRMVAGEQPAAELADQFVFVAPGVLLAAAGIASLLTGSITLLLAADPIVASIAALAVLTLPALLQRRLRTQRHARLIAALPDFQLLLAAGLRAGVGFSQAFSQSADHAAAALRQELGLIVRKQRVGVPLERALREFALRVPLHDIRMFAAAVSLAHEVGGSLAPTLERLARESRRRRAMQSRIGALTSQGRLQGIILTALPIVLLAVLSLLSPAAMAPLFSTPAGWGALALIVVLETVGWLMIRRIVAIEV